MASAAWPWELQRNVFLLGRVFFKKMLCRVAIDLYRGRLSCCLVIVSIGAGREMATNCSYGALGGRGGGGGGKTKQTRMKTKNEMLRRQQAKRVRAIGQIAGLVGNYLTS